METKTLEELKEIANKHAIEIEKETNNNAEKAIVIFLMERTNSMIDNMCFIKDHE